MRSPVQSWVPLQESTAKCCVFFVYSHPAFPKGLDIGVFWRWKLAFQAADMAMAGSERSERRLDGHSGKQHCVQGLSWVPCERTEWIRRSRPAATETSCVPLLRNQALTKVSWVLFWLWGTLGELENPEFRLIFIISIGNDRTKLFSFFGFLI